MRAARVKALGDAFGTLISLRGDISIENGREAVSARGFSEVRGEYLGDIRKPQQRVWYDDVHGLVIETTVQGRAREYSAPNGDIECVLTCDDSPTAQDAAEYKDGDKIYMRFRSGRSGHLAAFLIDEDGVHTLLPYTRDSHASTVKIERKHLYTFFSRDTAPEELRSVTDRYVLHSLRSKEHNRVCVVFSPNDFTRGLKEVFTGTGKTQFQSFEDFDNWLFEARSQDTEMAVIYKDIFIINDTLL